MYLYICIGIHISYIHLFSFVLDIDNLDYWGAFQNTRLQRLGRTKFNQLEKLKKLAKDHEILVRFT